MPTGIDVVPFNTDQIVNSFESLHLRQCEPNGFDWTNEEHTDLKAIFNDCKAKVTAGGLGDECEGADVVSLYFVCIANT